MNTKFLMDDYCFACGKKNEHGLKLEVVESESGVEAEIQPSLWTQGYESIVHGGIIATILDEMAVWAAYKKGYKSATAALNVRIKKAMLIGDKYIAKARVVAIKHGLIQAAAEIVNEGNELIAAADVKLMKIEQ